MLPLNIEIPEMERNQFILNNIKTYVKDLLDISHTKIGENYNIEISHHFGLKNFAETGAIIINLINREYCKKLIILMPNQHHPPHYHLKKEETFRLLYGDMEVNLNDNVFNLNLGESCLVKRGIPHSFSSKKGCIFEEISTHHYKGDSYYKDLNINALDLNERKTYVTNI